MQHGEYGAQEKLASHRWLCRSWAFGVARSHVHWVRLQALAQLAVEITQPLAWPVQDDPAYEDKLRDFVKQRLANVGAFVLFDESSHRQIELPGAWEELQETAQAGY